MLPDLPTTSPETSSSDGLAAWLHGMPSSEARMAEATMLTDTRICGRHECCEIFTYFFVASSIWQYLLLKFHFPFQDRIPHPCRLPLSSPENTPASDGITL